MSNKLSDAPKFDYPGDGSDSVIPTPKDIANLTPEQRSQNVNAIRAIREQRAQEQNLSNNMGIPAQAEDPSLPPAPKELPENQ